MVDQRTINEHTWLKISNFWLSKLNIIRIFLFFFILLACFFVIDIFLKTSIFKALYFLNSCSFFSAEFRVFEEIWKWLLKLHLGFESGTWNSNLEIYLMFIQSESYFWRPAKKIYPNKWHRLPLNWHLVNLNALETFINQSLQ